MKNKTFKQLIIFMLVSGVASAIQLVLVNVLYFALKDWKEPLPEFLSGIYSANAVGEGNNNWGYVLPFLISNLCANVYAYFQNKKTTFKSDAPVWHFVIYIILMICLILFSTWLQGVVVHAVNMTGIGLLIGFAPTIAAACAGTLQAAVLFPMEKFVLLKEKDNGDAIVNDKKEKRCNKCINRCPLDSPRCKTGRELAESGNTDGMETTGDKNRSSLRLLMDSYLWKIRNH